MALYQDSGGSVLIVGATGVVGSVAMDLRKRRKWDVSLLSRRMLGIETRAKWHEGDLGNLDSLTKIFKGTGPCTHIVYAALQEEAELVDGWTSESEVGRNAEILRNLLQALSLSGSRFEHLTLMQCTKVYGVHYGRYRFPAP